MRNAMVTLENYEEYMMLDADGELDAAGTAALRSFITLHPQLQQEYDSYLAARILPDAQQVYKHTQHLLKPEPRRTISLGAWWAYGAAAGIAAFIGIWMLKQEPRQPAIAVNSTISTPAIAKTTSPKAEKIIHSSPVNTATTIYDNMISQPAQTPPVTVAKQERKKNIPAPANKMLDENTVVNTAMIAAMPDRQRSLPTAVQQIDPSQVQAPDMPLPQYQEKENKVLLALLSEEETQGINNLKGAIADRIKEAKSIRKKIKDTDVTVALGKKELFVLKF